jgi:hypothetical protein
MPGRTRPIDKLATAVGKCSKEVYHVTPGIFSTALFLGFHVLTLLQSSVYGKCIFADYNNVHKNMCATEFMKLKECYLVRLIKHIASCRNSFVHRKRTNNDNGIGS